jgi:putative transposase
VRENNAIWRQIDKLSFISKNLYNYANYLVRQVFIWQKTYLNYDRVYHLVKKTADYQALPRKISQQVLRLLAQNWETFFANIKPNRERRSYGNLQK